jgi:hypothetical protein
LDRKAQIQLIFPQIRLPPSGKYRALLPQLGPDLLFFQLVLQSIILLHYFGPLGSLDLLDLVLEQFYLLDH